MRAPRFACAALIGAGIATSNMACERSGAPAAGEHLPVAAPQSATAPVKSEKAASPIFPAGLSVGGECPDTAAVSSEAASAIVPLKEGLTLSHMWIGKAGDYEHECLVQIKTVTPSYIDVTESCPVGDDRHIFVGERRLCRADMREGTFYLTQTSAALPPVISGTTMFSLSERSFRELKSTGQTRHRYIEIAAKWRTRSQPMLEDTEGILRSGKFDHEPYEMIVNDRIVELPAIVGMANLDKPTQTTARVLDDERFPLVLDYEVPGDGFRLQYTKISYPTDGAIERQLATEKQVDVYGIYFDVGSDAIRPESSPILREIADALARNADWTLGIRGHTDSIGGDGPNLDLSRRRAVAVRNALVIDHAIASGRLSTSGHGASQPHASNDTLDGRAKNRRVELVRQ